MDFRTRPTGERAEQYEREAKKFRRMAEAEPIGFIREQLTALAEQYQELAMSLLRDRH